MKKQCNYKIKLINKRFYTDNKLTNIEGIIDNTELDRQRVIQSAALRRLQQKTQVYPLEANASVRSRLTHSLEVQQIARSISRKILSKIDKSANSLDEFTEVFINIVEIACLLHDVGNPPFGHFGETTICAWLNNNLDSCYHQAMKNKYKPSELFTDYLLPDLLLFDGNAQGLRIIHSLHKLNLLLSQVASMVKYTIPAYRYTKNKTTVPSYTSKKPGFFYSEQLLIEEINKQLQIETGCRFPLVYIMEAADDIAYCVSDLEDAIDKNILSVSELKTCLIDIWKEQPCTNDYLINIIDQATKTAKEDKNFIANLRLLLTEDLIEHASSYYIKFHNEIFHGTLDDAIFHGNSAKHYALETLKIVAQRYVFTSAEKETPEIRGYAALTGLFDIYAVLLKLTKDDFLKLTNDKHNHQCGILEGYLFKQLPAKYVDVYKTTVNNLSTNKYSTAEINDLEWYYRVRLIIDYISGMTDNFVLSQYQKFSGV
jgi:dGTPase